MNICVYINSCLCYQCMPIQGVYRNEILVSVVLKLKDYIINICVLGITVFSDYTYTCRTII